MIKFQIIIFKTVNPKLQVFFFKINFLNFIVVFEYFKKKNGIKSKGGEICLCIPYKKKEKIMTHK